MASTVPAEIILPTQISLLNLTSQFVHVIGTVQDSEAPVALVPLTPTSFIYTFPRVGSLTLQLTNQAPSNDPSKVGGVGRQWTISLARIVSYSRHWEVVDAGDSPWLIYRFNMATKTSNHRLVIIPRRPLESFLASLPDRLPLSSLLLPGTHETMAFYGWPFSQCHTNSLAEQFSLGVRVVDIRIVIVDDVLHLYHGATDEHGTFDDVLQGTIAYLKSPAGKTETVVMSIQQEASFIAPSPLFEGTVKAAIDATREMWYLDNRIPTLGEVRGKIVLFSRFGSGQGWENGLDGMGIHPPIWTDSAMDGFSFQIKETTVRVQDWYNLPSLFSITDKATRAVSLLLPPPNPTGHDLSITYLSAASIPTLSFPPLVACGFGWARTGFGFQGVNDRAGRWLLGMLGGEHSDTMLGDQDWAFVAFDEESGGDGPRNEGKRPAAPAAGVTHAQDGEARTASTADPKIEEPRLRGWCMMDFISHPDSLGLIPLLVECNWRARKVGEEGWI